MNEQQTILAEVERCRAQLHHLIDERLDTFILRVTCGDLSEYIPDETVRAIPLVSAPARCKGMKPVAVILPDGSMVETSTWKKAAAAILRDCAADPGCHERLMELRGRVNGNFRRLLAEDPNGMDAPLKITEGLYLESKFDTQALLDTVLSYDVSAEQMKDWARMMDIEFVHITKDTTVDALEKELFLNDLAWKLK